MRQQVLALAQFPLQGSPLRHVTRDPGKADHPSLPILQRHLGGEQVSVFDTLDGVDQGHPGVHVRGDFIYRLWKPRTQARLELVLYFIFFFPGITALVFSGWKYAARSWGYLEVSSNSPAGVPIFQFKAVIVAAGILLFLQGVAQVFRCILCIRMGEWPKQAEDVEELEKVLLETKSLDVLKSEDEGFLPSRELDAGREPRDRDAQ